MKAMRMMKVIGTFLVLMLFLTLFFSMSFSTIVHATAQTSSVASTEESIITALTHSSYSDLSNLPTVEIVQNTQNDIEELYYFAFSLHTVDATVQHPDGTTETVSLSISWNCTDYTKEQIDPSVVGDYTETGTILLPEGNYTWGEGVLQTLTVPVKVIAPEEPVVITSINSFPANAFAIVQNGELSEILAQLSTTINCYDENGKTRVAGITWNTDTIDTSTVGVYTLTGEVTAPMHCTFADEIANTTISIPVSVQAQGKPNTNCYIIYYGYLMYFPWVMPEECLTSVQAWLQKDDGEWTLLSEDDMDIEYSTDSFGLCLDILETSHTYKLQVDYEGGQTSIVSFQYNEDGTTTMQSIVDGDRDGGDTDGNTSTSTQEGTSDSNTESNDSGNSDSSKNNDGNTTPNDSDSPDSSANADTNTDSDNSTGDKDEKKTTKTTTSDKKKKTTNSNTNKKSSANNDTNNNSKNGTDSNNSSNTNNHTETGSTSNASTDADITSAISAITTEQNSEEQNSKSQEDSSTDVAKVTGAELRLMLQTSDIARFSCNGITVSCPAAALEALNISDEDVLKISIVPDDAGGFTLSITLNETPITELPGMQIMVPFPATSDSPALSLLDGNKNLITTGTYDNLKKLATFTIDQTGYFTILDENATDTDSQNPFIILISVISFIGIVLLACFIVYQTRRSRI